LTAQRCAAAPHFVHSGALLRNVKARPATMGGSPASAVSTAGPGRQAACATRRVSNGASNFANINDWVRAPDFALENSDGGDSWHQKRGDGVTEQDAAFEFVFRPLDYTGTLGLFNTGGNGDGLGIVLVGSVLEFRYKNGNDGNETITLSTDLNTIAPAGNFFHMLVNFDVVPQAGDGAEMFINGVREDFQALTNVADWDGGETAELGLGGNIPGGSATPFDGDIALFQYYENQRLSQSEVNTAFGAAVPEPSSFLLVFAGVLGVILFHFRGRRQRLQR